MPHLHLSLVLLGCTAILLLSGFGQAVVVDQVDEDRAIDAITTLISDQDGGGPRPPRNDTMPRIPNPAAKIVRLLFHDCVVSGCDGCLEIGNPENNGLAEISARLNMIYNDSFSESGMSRADFWALASVVAIRVAADEQQCDQLELPQNCTKPMPRMSILYGRKDCANSPLSNSDTGFPDAHGDLDHVMEIFRDGLGMTERQVVALIGAHTLGSASTRNSGFDGPWAPPTTRFDNGFYRLLVGNNSGWRQVQLNSPNAPEGFNPRFQWDHGNFQRMPGGDRQGLRMMLNTDMALFKQVVPGLNGRETDDDCRRNFTDCDPSRTAAIAVQYARNNTRWHEDFGPAFQILLEHGYPDNHLVAAGETLPVLVDPTSRPVVMTDEPTTTFASAVISKAAVAMVMLGAIVAALIQ